jgi:hypothetical protein
VVGVAAVAGALLLNKGDSPQAASGQGQVATVPDSDSVRRAAEAAANRGRSGGVIGDAGVKKEQAGRGGDTPGSGTGGPTGALAETPEVRLALDSLETLTDDGTTDAQNQRALDLASRLSPATALGRVELKYRRMEAYVNLNRNDEVCRLLAELERDTPRGTKFRESVELFRSQANANGLCQP